MPNSLSLKQVHRQLELTVQAVWGRSVRVLELPSDGLSHCPKLEADTLYLPSVINGYSNEFSPNYYLCAALHASAHLIYSQPSDGSGLNNRQLVLISLIEDARVEALLLKKLPGLRPFFLAHFHKPTSNSLIFEDIAYALALSLLKQEIVADNPLIRKVFERFYALSDEALHDHNISKKIGLALANDIGQMRISMNETTAFELVSYRDDNAYLWQKNTQVGMESDTQEQSSQDEKISVTGMAYEETRQGKSVSAYQNNVENQPGLVISETEKVTENRLLQATQSSQTICYPEWDYKIARLKSNWCSVTETVFMDEMQSQPSARKLAYQGLILRLQKIIQSYQSSQQRRTKQEDGVELDLAAMIEQRIAMKTGNALTEAKIYIDHFKQQERELALLVLLDLSESMNDKVIPQHTLLDLTLDASIVLFGVLDALGHPYALHGFNSNTRNQVNYVKFKEFESAVPLNIAELESAKAEYSTRLGAGLRHAFQSIRQRPERHKLIMVITDGQPSDIDVHDARYLIEDASYAVREIENTGCRTFCLSLDQSADDYAGKIFRTGHYAIVDHPQKLTQTLTRFYLKLFRACLH